ncbi:invasion associated locus B family protein [Pontixanthobacter sp. CEM42]|uniref:invasion associated locus B family protein n=1 Tax=Pontixanthobacter sp. CEM42 TaxID=2792077 RepID=UPI0032AF2E20
MRFAYPALALAAFACLATPLAARDSLGIFSDWGAFRDPETPRCYAIAKAAPSNQQRDNDPFASIGTWPSRQVRNQLHLRMSRNLASDSSIRLSIGDRTFELTGSGGNAWAKDQRMDAAIVAAMRSASRMVVRAKDSRGRNFSNTYDLEGAATAMDAATVGCAQLGR